MKFKRQREMYRGRFMNKPPCCAWNIVFVLKYKELQRWSAVRTYHSCNKRGISVTYMGSCGSLRKVHNYYFITSTSITTYIEFFLKKASFLISRKNFCFRCGI